MSTIIKIKNSGVSGSPTSLGTGEFAYSYLGGTLTNGGDRLYIGTGTETAGVAANLEVVGGKYFTDMLDHTKGILTANSALVVDGDSKLDRLNVDDIRLDGSTITTQALNQDLTLTADGTGRVVVTSTLVASGGIEVPDIDLTGTATIGTLVVPDLDANRITYTTTGGQVTSTPSFTFDGTTLSLTGQANVDNLRLDGNTVSATDLNGNIVLSTPGTGRIELAGTQGVILPVGTLAQRPAGVAGMVRYSSSTNLPEYYNGNAWKPLAGVWDVDQDTYITAQDSDVADNDELDFFAGGAKRFTVATDGVRMADTTIPLEAGNLELLQNTLSSSTGDITFDPASGKVVVDGDLQINGTTTTINSTEITLDDPVLTLGGDTAPTADDNKDRGIQFRYYDTQARVGFFGWDDSNAAFTFLENATNTGEVFSGTLASIRTNRVLTDGLDFSTYTGNGVTYVDGAGAIQFAYSGVEGHVLQVDGSGVPFFGIVDGGTY